MRLFNEMRNAGLATMAMLFGTAPTLAASDSTALTSQEIAQIINGPCRSDAVSAENAANDFGMPWGQIRPKVEEQFRQDLPVAELEQLIDKTAENIRLYHDDLAGEMDDYKLCLYQQKLVVSAARRNAFTSTPKTTALPPAPAQFTPPTGNAGNKTLDTVASGLMTILGANGAANFSSGDAMIDAIVNNLTASLSSGGPVGSDQALLNNVLSAVRNALAGSDTNASTGQLVDLVMGVVKSSLASARPSSVPLPPLQIPTPAPVLAPPAALDSFATDAQSIYAAFGRMGQNVIWDNPSEVGPVIKHADNQYTVYLYGCLAGGNCNGMQLLACYTYPYASMAKANEWNRSKLQGRAFINSSGNLCVDQYIDLNGSVMEDRQFKTIFDIYYNTLSNAPTQFNSP